MSKYTTELRYICESYAGLNNSAGYNSVNNVLENSWDKVFDFDFPIFDEQYRKPLCKKILKHYYTREICEETVGLWKLRLDSAMNDIMPYYNKLYDSELISIAPLVNYRVNTTGNNSKTGQDTVTGRDDTTDRTVSNVSGGKYGGFTDTHTGTDTSVKSGNEVLQKQGKENLIKSGSETSQKQGKETDVKSGSEELAKSGSEKVEYKGREDFTKQGTEAKTRTGNETEAYNNLTDAKKITGGYSDKNEINGKKVNEHSVTEGNIITTDVNLFTDTPQGNIGNMGTNYGTQQNPSPVPIVGDDTSYLTTAEKNTSTTDDTRVIKDKTYGENDYSDTVTRDYHGKTQNDDYTEENVRSGNKTNNYNNVKDETSFTNRKDSKEFYQREDETSFNQRKDTKSYNNVTDEKSFTDRQDIKTFNNVKDEKSFTDRTDTTTFNNVQEQETKNLTDARVYNQQDVSENIVNKQGANVSQRTTTYGNTNAYIDNVVGSKGISDSKLLKEFRETFLNIDEMIIDRLANLFILLW